MLSFELGDRIGFLTDDVDGDGKPLLIGIQKNVDLDGEKANRIRSAYGLDHPAEWIHNQLEEGKTARVYDMKKAESFLDSVGYLAERPENFRFGGIVALSEKESKSGFFRGCAILS